MEPCIDARSVAVDALTVPRCDKFLRFHRSVAVETRLRRVASQRGPRHHVGLSNVFVWLIDGPP